MSMLPQPITSQFATLPPKRFKAAFDSDIPNAVGAGDLATTNSNVMPVVELILAVRQFNFGRTATPWTAQYNVGSIIFCKTVSKTEVKSYNAMDALSVTHLNYVLHADDFGNHVGSTKSGFVYETAEDICQWRPAGVLVTPPSEKRGFEGRVPARKLVVQQVARCNVLNLWGTAAQGGRYLWLLFCDVPMTARQPTFVLQDNSVQSITKPRIGGTAPRIVPYVTIGKGLDQAGRKKLGLGGHALYVGYCVSNKIYEDEFDRYGTNDVSPDAECSQCHMSVSELNKHGTISVNVNLKMF